MSYNYQLVKEGTGLTENNSVLMQDCLGHELSRILSFLKRRDYIRNEFPMDLVFSYPSEGSTISHWSQ